MFRFLHTADLHIEAPFGYLPWGKRVLRRQGLRDVFTKIIDLALKERVDALLVAGDLFDSPQPTQDSVKYFRSELVRLAEHSISLFLIPGNHDYFRLDSIYNGDFFLENVHIFKEDKWKAIELPKKDVVVFGIACHSLNSERNALAELNSLVSTSNSQLSVGLLHGSLDYGFYNGEQCYPFSTEDAQKVNLDYLALGHYHNKQILKNSVACYAGSPESLKFSEGGEHSLFLVELKKEERKITPISVNNFRSGKISLDCTSFDNSEMIKREISRFGGSDMLLKVDLTGSPSLDLDVDSSTLTEVLKDNFFFLEINDKLSLPNLEHDSSLTVKTLFLKKMDELLVKAETEEERHKINLATRLGIMALEKRLG